MMDEQRALSAYTDVLAVEFDEESGMVRIVTMSDCYHAVPEEGMHLCPDREYHDVDFCKHTIATEITRGRIDAPSGWLETENLDERPERKAVATDGGQTDGCDCKPDSDLECWQCFNADSDSSPGPDAGENTTEPVDQADGEILRAMRARFVSEQTQREPEVYHGSEDPGCTEREFERMVLG